MSINGIFSRRRKSGADGEKVSCPEKINSEKLKKAFSSCCDFELREVACGGVRAHVFWIDGLVSGSSVSECVLRPMTDETRLPRSASESECIELIMHGAVYQCSVKRREALDEVCSDLVSGFTAVVFDGEGAALCFETRTDNARSISEPTIEKAVMAAKDAFVETLRTNTSLVRRKLRSPRLKVWETTIGRRSGTRVCIMYIEGLTNTDTVSELRRRLGQIDIDGLVTAGALEQRIIDEPRSPFPQLMHTERPDKFASELLAGRVGLLADGLPIGFLLPVTLGCFLRVTEDRAKHFLSASFLLILRWLSLILAVILPALLVAVAMYHQEMIPNKLLMSMIEAKQKVPFSVSVEVLSMLVAFELLREAGVRLPDPVGDTVSIIGALIVGQSAVEARVVSPIAVIVVATAGICGFTQPSQDMGAALRIIRILLVCVVIVLGMFGLMLGTALIVYHLCTIDSFGVNYTSALSDGGWRRSARDFIQIPLWRDDFRARELKTQDRRRQR